MSEEQEARCLQQARSRDEEEEKIQRNIARLRRETRAARRQLRRLKRDNDADQSESSCESDDSEDERDEKERGEPEKVPLSPEEDLKGRRMVRAARCVQVRDIQRLPTTPFSLMLRKEYFDCPQRDSHAVHYI